MNGKHQGGIWPQHIRQPHVFPDPGTERDMNQICMRSTALPGSDDAAAWLAAIVDNSSDAILSKTLDGVITSWNSGAERLFGYAQSEAVGKPITLIIPDDRLHEEADIIARLRRGERIDRFETVRRTRQGTPVHIEVTISPVRDRNGTIIGASKIARDIGERIRHAEQQKLLAREMHHRVKNLLAIVQGVVNISGRRATGLEAFIEDLNGRIAALAAVQRLVLPHDNAASNDEATLGKLLAAIMAPYMDDRVCLPHSDLSVGERSVTSLALIFHELATNAVKHGALSNTAGRLDVACDRHGETIAIDWRETGGSPPDGDRQGFGTDLLQASARSLGGTIERRWDGGAFHTIVTLSAKSLSH